MTNNHHCPDQSILYTSQHDPSRPSWSIQHILYLGEDIVGLLSIEEAIQVSTAISVDQLTNNQQQKKTKEKNKYINN